MIFSYFNPILRFGLHKFADDAAAAGVDGVLVTDLIVEEAGDTWRRWPGWGLRRFFWPRPPVPMSGLKPSRRIRKGFVYAISRVGITGKQQSLTSDAAALVERIRRWTSCR